MRKPYPQEVYLNNQWLPHEHAVVSVFDRGFMLGDGIYEVIPFYGGKPFTLREHLERLTLGLQAVRLNYDTSGLEGLIFEAISRAGLTKQDGTVYLQVTRGAAPRTHFFPDVYQPSLLLYAAPYTFKGFQDKHVNVMVTSDFRWHRCDIKSISLMANILANDEAHGAGFTESIFVREGIVTEGTHTSVFFVRKGVVYTHPSGPHILPGITRAVVKVLCEELGIPFKEEAVQFVDLADVDEAFLTGTTAQITSIGVMVANGREITMGSAIGPITKRIQEAFINRVAST